MPDPVDEGHIVIVLGATGDLVGRKLLPGLYEVSQELGRKAEFPILGTSRASLSDAEFQQLGVRSLVAAKVASPAAARSWCRRHLTYESLGKSTAEDYRRLAARAAALEKEHHLPGNRIVYLALPSAVYPEAIARLGDAGLHRSKGWTRLVIEKPFGRDLASARRLNRRIHRYFHENEVYRIDHYLGKETVQNLLIFRFANMLFESAWNRERIDHVEITVAEKIGVENRAGYYEEAGQLRDMVQSHLMQLLTLTAMEVPSHLNANQVRNEKVKVLQSLAPIAPEDVVFGQYAPGTIDGKKVVGYREEPGVAPRSNVETFVALRLNIDNWRWHGIPFFLRTGKRLAAYSTRIVVRFRAPPVWFFASGGGSADITENTLTITLQPDEGFELGIEIKRPGHNIELATQHLRFRYSDAFGPLPDAYRTLLMDVLRGDPSLFVRADEVEESWRVLDPILRNPPKPRPYASGSWGPAEGDALLASHGGHAWLNP